MYYILVEKSGVIWCHRNGYSGSRKQRLVVRKLGAGVGGGGGAGVNGVQAPDVNAHFHRDLRNSIR
jgi:hypothetical protein